MAAGADAFDVAGCRGQGRLTARKIRRLTDDDPATLTQCLSYVPTVSWLAQPPGDRA